MKSIKTSLRDLNTPHPLVAGPTSGLLAVAMVTLSVPSGLEFTEAWGLFVSVGAGAGLGRLIVERRHEGTEGPHQ